MTEKTPKTTQPVQADEQAGAKPKAPNDSAGKTATAPTGTPGDKKTDKTTTATGGSQGNVPPGAAGKRADGSGRAAARPSRVPLVLGIVVALALAGGLWYQHTLSQDAITRLEAQTRASSDQATLASQQAQQALSALRQQDSKIDRLLADMRESREELRGLGEAFQMITDRGSDLVLLNDVDHLVTIAQQQLQLSGNVANAIISLETAQAQLARANRPALASLQQTINGDLDRLRAATTVDIALLSSRLDELSGLIAQAPLIVPDDAAPDLVPDQSDENRASATTPSRAPDAPHASNQAWWERALDQTRDWTSRTFSSIRDDLGQFVSVRRVDDPTALLISPDQATRFRDNLRLRIMTAQLALMMDQSQIWKTETTALLDAVESRYDPRSPLTRQALKIARDVADTSIDTALPTVNNSIKALEALREQSAADSMSKEPRPMTPATRTQGQNGSSDDDAAAGPAAAGPAEDAAHAPVNQESEDANKPTAEPDQANDEPRQDSDQPEQVDEQPGPTDHPSDQADEPSAIQGD